MGFLMLHFGRRCRPDRYKQIMQKKITYHSLQSECHLFFFRLFEIVVKAKSSINRNSSSEFRVVYYCSLYERVSTRTVYHTVDRGLYFGQIVVTGLHSAIKNRRFSYTLKLPASSRLLFVSFGSRVGETSLCARPSPSSARAIFSPPSIRRRRFDPPEGILDPRNFRKKIRILQWRRSRRTVM